MPSQAVLELLVELKDQTRSGLDSIGGALKTVGGIAGGVALAGVAAFGAAVVSGIGDAREAAQIYAQTEAVIKSTGGAAGVSAQQVADYAASLSAAAGKSLFGDDQIQQSENLLLTFTNIKGAALEGATAISVDMAQALGGAPKDAAIQLGKALNDPINGITALTRVGVTFDDAQKKQIETMVKAGNVAGAQQIILAELNKEFGGSAEAAAKADGGWAQFNDRLGEAKEALGTAVLPLLTTVVGFLSENLLPVLEDGAEAFGNIISVLSTGDFSGGIFGLSEDAPFIVALFTLRDIGGQVIGTIQQIAAAFTDGGLQGAAAVVGETLGGLAANLITMIGDAAPGIVAALAAWGSALVDWIIAAAPGLFQQLLALDGQIIAWIAEKGPGILAQLAEWGGAFVLWVIETAPKLIVALGEMLAALIGWVIGHREEIAATLVQWGEAFARWVTDVAIPGLLAALANLGTQLVGWIGEKARAIAADGSVGRALLDGIRNGIAAGWEALKRFVGDVAGSLLNAAKDALGIHSPSVAAAVEIGQPFAAGIVQGIQDGTSAVLSTALALGDAMIDGVFPSGSPLRTAIETVGAPFGKGIAEGVRRTASEVLSAIDATGTALFARTGAMLGGLQDAFGRSGAPGAARDLGAAIVGGLVDGMRDNLGAALSAATGAASAITDSMKGALQIGSPSRVTADEIGMPFVQGIAQGILSATAFVQSAVAKLSDDMLKQLGTLAEQAQALLHDALKGGFGATADIARRQMANLKSLGTLGGGPADVNKKQAELDAILERQRDVQARIAELQAMRPQTEEAAVARNKELQALLHEQLDLTDARTKKEQERSDAIDEQIRQQQAAKAVQAQLAEAERQMQAIRARDPELAAKFFDLRSKQIFELASLQEQLAKTQDFDERARIQQQIDLAKQAQAAELAAFDLTAQESGGQLKRLRDQLQTLFDALSKAKDAASLAAAAQVGAILAQIGGGPGISIPSTVPAGGGGIIGAAGALTIRVILDDQGAGLLRDLVRVEVDRQATIIGSRADTRRRTGG